MTPQLTPVERKKAAKAFAAKWAGRGYEKGDTASFWLELLRDVVGVKTAVTYGCISPCRDHR